MRHRKPASRPSRNRTRPPGRLASGPCGAALLATTLVAAACGKEEAPRPPPTGGRTVRELPPPPGAGPKHFVNTKEALVAAAPDLTAHFLPFSFDLPDGWIYQEGGSRPPRTNFVKVERRVGPKPPAENFSVGAFWSSASTGPIAADVLTAKIDKFKKTVERSMPDTRILANAALPVDGRPARGFRFATLAPGESPDAPPIEGFGLVLFVPDVSGSDGAVLILMGTVADRRFTSADDVGVKGEGPTILASLKFGK